MQLSTDLLTKLPKTDLHCHYDGSLRLSTVIELAQRYDVKLFSYDHDTLAEHMKYGRIRSSLVDYLEGFLPLIDVVQEMDDIERTFYEVCADAALENVWHLELRYCPLLHTKKKLRPDEVVAACVRGAHRAEKEFNMSVRQILCGLKHLPKDVDLLARLAVSFADQGVVGFDLAGPEIGYPIIDHLAGIQIAKRHHLFLTMHAGEATGPQTIAEALYDAGAHRIGHGTSLINDDAILNYVINHRIGIESCPISNLHTGSVKSLKDHPLPFFLRRGVRVSINTDNRLVSMTTITRELSTMIETFDLDKSEVHQLLANGFKSAFLPHAHKGALLREFEKEWARLIEIKN